MPYKILLITSMSKPWNNGWYYKKGFEKNGHEVISYDPVSIEDPAGTAIRITIELKPDFILYTKNELPVEVFYELKKHTKVIQWYPDPVIPHWLPAYVKASDIFFTMSEGLVDEFRKLNRRSFWLSQAFEPSFFEVSQLTSEDVKRYSADVTFVGNLGSKKQYLSRRESLRKVISAGFRLKWWGPKIPRKLSTVPLILGRLGRSYGGKFIWGKEYAKIARLSKIFLAFDSMPHIRKSMSARMYTAVGCRAFYMCQYVEGIEKVLEPDKEIVIFHSDDEMIDKIRFYLQKDNLRKKIAEAGQRRVLKYHTYQVRIKEMLKKIEEYL